MEYGKLVAVTGMPGLFELVSSRNDGGILRSLEDNKAQFVSNRAHTFSHLESIEIFTVRDNVNLVDLFIAMDKAGGSLPDAKDNTAIKKYFEKVFPDMDFERVYPSDMKKMVKWFEILQKNKVELKLTEVPEEEEEEEVEVEVKEAKPKKAAAKAEKAPKKETKSASPDKSTKKSPARKKKD